MVTNQSSRQHPVFAKIRPQRRSLGLREQNLPTQANIKSDEADYPAGTPSANVRVAATLVVRCFGTIGMLPSSVHRTALLVLSLGLVIPTGFPVLAQAQTLYQRGLARAEVSTEQTRSLSARRYSSLISQARVVRFPSVGAPRRREGAAVRGSCDSIAEKPVPLLPTTEPVLTAAKYPTFFVDLPKSSAKQAELFLLSSDKEREIYKTTVTLPDQPGIVSFSFPADGTLPPLEVGKNYYWQLSVICDSQDQEKNMLVEGPVQRVELNPNLLNKLKQASPREYPAIYAEAGIWYDAITSLAQLRRSSPNDSTIAADWTELLKSVGLDAVAQKPLIP